MRPPESFLGQPIRSLQTMLRIIAEDDSRHVSVIPDGIYGSETIRAISTFQQIHGLPVTGITDNDTWVAVVATYEPANIRRKEAEPLELILNPGQIIRKGERHPHINLVQGILQILSDVYKSITAPPVTGILDDTTADALASFQYLTNLPMTGDLDKHTWKHLSLHYPLAAVLTETINR